MGWFLIIAGLGLIGFVVYMLMFPSRREASGYHQRMERIQGKHSPEQTRFEARKETKAAAARTEEATQLGAEARAVSDMIKQRAEAEANQFGREAAASRFRRHEQLEQANHALTLHLTNAALSQGVDIPTLIEFRRRAELDRLELEKQWKEAEQALKAGFIYQLQAHQHLSLLTEYIGGLYTRAKILQAEGKDRELQLIEEHIAFMEGDFRERQRLLQGSQQSNAQGSRQNPQAPGSIIGTVETDTE